MTSIEEAREQARKAQEQISNRLVGSRLGLSSTREMDKDMLALSNGLDALSALLDATEPPAKPKRGREVTHSITAEEYARVIAKVYEPDLDWDNPAEYDLTDRAALVESAEKILARLKWAGFSVELLDDLCLDEMNTPDTPAEDEREAPSVEWALSYARRYWQFGNEPQSQAALHALSRAVDGPRPITDEAVEAADRAIMPYWGERYPSGSLTTEIARAALAAAEEARR